MDCFHPRTIFHPRTDFSSAVDETVIWAESNNSELISPKIIIIFEFRLWIWTLEGGFYLVGRK